MTLKKQWICCLAGTLACAIGFAPAFGTTGEKTEISKTAENPPGIELPPQSAQFIEVAPVVPQTNQIWGRRIPARVSLQTSAHVSVGAMIDGRVEQVLVRPGEVVQAGAPLIKIHSANGGQARAEAQTALARLEAAEENLRRFTNMLAKGVATELEVYEAQVKAKEARIDVERTRGANSLLGDGNGVQFFITAPTNGVVLAVSASIGAALQPGSDVVEIGDPSRVWIEAEMGEEDAMQVFRGQQALVELPRGREVHAVVETVNIQVDPVTRRRKVFLMPETRGSDALAPGMLVNARLAEPRDQLLLPVAAVLIKDGEHRIVYVQGPDGKLRPRDVLVNSPSNGFVRVLQGLQMGEKVVVKGALLVDGRSEQLL